MAAVYATVLEVRTALGSRLPTDPVVSDAAVTEWIARATDAIDCALTYRPLIGDDDRPSDEEQKRWLIVAVADIVHALYRTEGPAATLSPDLQAIIAAGGRVKAGKLEVQGASGGQATGGLHPTGLTRGAARALWRAGLYGGPVTSW